MKQSETSVKNSLAPSLNFGSTGNLSAISHSKSQGSSDASTFVPSKDNVKVIIRVRPFNEVEKSKQM